MQQGRIQVDSDWNEQANIFVHELRRLAQELIGPHGGSGNGFKIVPVAEKNNFGISFGSYFVDGIRCDNQPPTGHDPLWGAAQQASVPYSLQPNYPLPPRLQSNSYLVYLEVWERAITYIEDPALRDVALGGADTSVRTKVVWQVKALADPPLNGSGKLEIDIEQWLDQTLPGSTVRLSVTVGSPAGGTMSPSGYSGLENHLYRVEIHDGGQLSDGATFKWSRDNGSITFPVSKVAGQLISLRNMGRPGQRPLSPGSWVEYEDDQSVLRNERYSLSEVDKVYTATNSISLREPIKPNPENSERHYALLRLWDGPPQKARQRAKTGEANEDGAWIGVENGINIRFVGGTALPGDYWLIPARSADGSIEWPEDPRQPFGTHCHRAPLAAIRFDRNGNMESDVIDLRRVFGPSTK